MIAFLILPVLTSGYYIFNHNPFYIYKLHRYEGQHLYIKSAALGLWCLFWTLVGSFAATTFLPSTLFGIGVNVHQYLTTLLSGLGLPNDIKPKQISWLILVSVGIQLVAWCHCKLGFVFIKLKSWRTQVDANILLMSRILSDSPLDAELLRSNIYQLPVLISLSNDKVYVGIAITMGEPNEHEGLDQEISILPLMSGYREQKTRNVVFDTDYQSIRSSADLLVTIRQDLIEMVSRFDFDVYEQFGRQTPKNKIRITLPAQ